MKEKEKQSKEKAKKEEKKSEETAREAGKAGEAPKAERRLASPGAAASLAEASRSCVLCSLREKSYCPSFQRHAGSFQGQPEVRLVADWLWKPGGGVKISLESAFGFELGNGRAEEALSASSAYNLGPLRTYCITLLLFHRLVQY